MIPHVVLSHRFAGRTDVYGHAGHKPYCVKRPLDNEVWAGHVMDGDPIGVYPLRQDSMVHWGCSDFDTADAEPEARAVQQALRVMGIPSWPEISRSKGYHLWVFLAKNVWVPAQDMRYTLLLAHHLAEVPAKEVNPKNTDGRAIGNFVRIPYPGASLGQGRQVMLSRTGWKPLTLRAFLDEAGAGVATPMQLKIHAGVWASTLGQAQEEPVQRGAAYDGSLDELVRQFDSGSAVNLFRNGPPNGDRSEGLWILANNGRRAELTPEQTLSLVVDADLRWGKHEGDPDVLWKYYVSRAYGEWVE